MRKKVNVIIEMACDGWFSCYMDETPGVELNYAVIGTGATVDEAKADFDAAYGEMREYFAEEGKPFQEIDYDFSFDYASVLGYYNNSLTLEQLHEITGVEIPRLEAYISGAKKPPRRTFDMIQRSIREFLHKMSQAAAIL